MNLAIRGIDSNLGEVSADRFTKDLHSTLLLTTYWPIPNLIEEEAFYNQSAKKILDEIMLKQIARKVANNR